MPRSMAQLHDRQSGRDAFVHLDLPHVTSKLAAWFVVEEQLAEAKFEVVDVSEMITVSLQAETDVPLDELPTVTAESFDASN